VQCDVPGLVALIQVRSPPVFTMKILTPRPTCPIEVGPPPILPVKTRTPRPTRPWGPALHHRPALPPQLIQIIEPSHFIHPTLSNAPWQVGQQPQDGEGTKEGGHEESDLDECHVNSPYPHKRDTFPPPQNAESCVPAFWCFIRFLREVGAARKCLRRGMWPCRIPGQHPSPFARADAPRAGLAALEGMSVTVTSLTVRASDVVLS
jgi:hypothetical protein